MDGRADGMEVKTMIPKGLGIVDRHGIRAAVWRMFRRREPPKGIGLLHAVRRWVHRAGKVWPWPSPSAWRLKRALQGADEVDIVLSHGWGGGAESYLAQKIRQAPRNRAVFVAQPSSAGGGGIDGALHFQGKTVRFIAGGLAVFNGLAGRKCRIVLNELARWPRIGAPVGNPTAEWLADNILELKRRVGGEMVYLLHDYYCICPKVALVAPDGFYCRSEASMARCEECLKTSGMLELEEGGIDIARWRREFGRLLSGCERVIAFSEDTKTRMERCMGGLRLEVIPHELPTAVRPCGAVKGEPPTIGVFGFLQPMKGLWLVKELAEHLLALGEHTVRIKIVGTVPDHVDMPGNVDILGRYEIEKLPSICADAGINVAFFPSVCPETFSFATKEIIGLGLPVACFDLGAQRDQVKVYPNGAIIPQMTAKSAWETILRLHARVYGHGPGGEDDLPGAVFPEADVS